MLLLLLLAASLAADTLAAAALGAAPREQDAAGRHLVELEVENARLRQQLLLARATRPRWEPPSVGRLKASKPNILLVFGDDVGYADLGAFGHPTARTPHLDHLAATGAKLTQYYSAASICSPSRGSLITGPPPPHPP
jgi:hypothetical protein